MTSTSTGLNDTARGIALGADHGGYALKQDLLDQLAREGWTTYDCGTHSAESTDYPDYAKAVCESILRGQASFGILLCRSGVGMSIAANRFPYIRAAVVNSPEEARLTRGHNNSNVLCMSADEIDTAQAIAIMNAFLETPFEGGRHQRRVDKIEEFSPCSNTPLERVDPDIANVLAKEEERQRQNIELIASENFTSSAVRQAQGSVLTNKYAEGYPGKRWYGGCEFVDIAEQLAIDRACELFGAEHANVQPHSGSQANAAVYFAALEHGDKILTMDLSHGGHLTHGHPANFSGKFYQVTHYGVSETDEQIDYESLLEKAKEVRPKMITAGASAYPRTIDFAAMREIADAVGALLFIDMAHIAGLVAAGEHPSPIGLADFVTTTTHKSLRGPRGGMILCGKEWAKKIDAMVFPGVQGGPLMHVIAAKAVCLKEALSPSFKEYQSQVVRNARALAEALATQGYRIVSGGTENHLLLVDLRPQKITGKVAQEALDHSGITVNKNSIPFDTVPIFQSGGIRLGTPAVTTRGMKEPEMARIAQWTHATLSQHSDPQALASIREEVIATTRDYPLP